MHSRSCAVALLAGVLALAAPIPAAAQAPTPGANRDRGFTVTAVRIPTPLGIDGTLDEGVYARVPSAHDFIQQEPNEGQAATEKTEVWVFFDDTRIYVAARCWDSQPERITSSELRRDVVTISQNDHLVVTFDTFNDRRTGYYFQTTLGGAIRDQVVTDDRPNADWNTVWETRSARFDHGYALEMAIPFKSLRYAGSGPQTWGVNFRRFVAWKNEMQFLTPMPAAFAQSAVTRFADSATLVGLETPARTINMEVKPYGVTSLTTDRAAATPFNNHGRGSAGVDLKYGLTRGLEANVTVNTDFAQVEEDVQQVNLTRFSLFLPEKRDFFLESQGLFTFADPGITGPTLAPGDVPLLFFSRRIGLHDGQSIPVVAGGRIWGKAGPASIGLLHIRTGDKPEANARTTDFSVARLKWDVLGRSSVGLMATRRATSLAHDTNTALGADTSLLFFQNVSVRGYYAQTSSPGRSTHNTSYRGSVRWGADRYGLSLEHITVDPNFDAGVGYVRRTDFARTSLTARFSPRPARSRVIRKYVYLASLDYTTDAALTTLQNREPKASFAIDFQNSDILTVEIARDDERLPRTFAIAPGVLVPTGPYTSDVLRVNYLSGYQRRVSGRVAAGVGSFYAGTLREASYTGRVVVQERLAVEPGLSLNWVDLPFGEFTVRQFTTRIILTPSPRMLISGLAQFNAATHAISSSLRLHWEYQPGSDLFLVYSEGRDTTAPGFPDRANHSVALKVTRLVRF